MAAARMEAEYVHQQIKMLNKREISMFLSWTILGAFLVLVSALLAVPAAIQAKQKRLSAVPPWATAPVVARSVGSAS